MIDEMPEETMQEFDEWVRHHERSDEGVIELSCAASSNPVMQAFYKDMFRVVSNCMNCGEKVFPTYSETDQLEVRDDSVLIRGVARCNNCGESQDVNIRKYGEAVFFAMLSAMGHNQNNAEVAPEPPF